MLSCFQFGATVTATAVNAFGLWAFITVGEFPGVKSLSFQVDTWYSWWQLCLVFKVVVQLASLSILYLSVCLTFSLFACICSCVYIVHVCVLFVYVETWGDIRCLCSSALTLFCWVRASHWTWSSPILAVRASSLEGPPVSIPSAEIMGGYNTYPAFYVGSGAWTLVLRLVWQAESFPQPLLYFF